MNAHKIIPLAIALSICLTGTANATRIIERESVYSRERIIIIEEDRRARASSTLIRHYTITEPGVYTFSAPKNQAVEVRYLRKDGGYRSWKIAAGSSMDFETERGHHWQVIYL